jgi:hypothetical protein
MNHLAYICEGYLFVPCSNLKCPQEVLGSFYYEEIPINVILTKARDLEEIRKISLEDVVGMDPIKDTIDKSIYYAIKKMEYMSKKEPVKIPFKIKFEKGKVNFSFDDNKDTLKIYLEDLLEQKCFYFPCPQKLSEKVED